MKVSQEDLENTALCMEQKDSSPEEPINIDGFVSPTSPTSPLHGWDPMKEDFLSSKNTYAVNPDDLDIAFQGYQDLSRRVCRYFRTRSGCWRGDQCPNLHVKKGEDLHEMVEVFCDNMDSSVTLPDIGTWVAVRVTAVFNPGHFWVQFPYGTEPIEKSIMAGKPPDRRLLSYLPGAWCHDPDTCYERSNTELGSSKCFPRYLRLEGLLSNRACHNPDFYTWTSVFIRYCDGASFTGDRAHPLEVNNRKLYFRGRRILDAVLDEFLRRGINHASEIIVGGRSAGALTAMIHSDYIRKRFQRATNASFRVLSDAGFFVDAPSLNGSEIIQSVFRQAYSLHNSSMSFNRGCVRAQKWKQEWRCFFPQYLIPFLSSPIFLVNSLYDLWQIAFLSNVPCVLKLDTCNTSELSYIMSFRDKTLQALRSVFNADATAVFADACFVHTQTVMNDLWTNIRVQWTRENHVKRMLPHFLHLPFQALECFLGNVEPTYNHQKNGKKLDWSEDAMKTFSSLTEDKTLIAHVLSKAWNQTVYVDLWDTEGDEEIHINKVLIEKGFAHETDHTVSNPWNIEASFEVNPHKTVGLPG
ncbi:unnamed protein product [Porites evermanni]|uniref:C3H1-type domain-containing protein n=1 Tax=Porites evermanni TaxID=104178 RepID=A0ABN8STI4_9CNID|nr:unnamed protein product [Porites evermanni]